jgi:hypothetical protein
MGRKSLGFSRRIFTEVSRTLTEGKPQEQGKLGTIYERNLGTTSRSFHFGTAAFKSLMGGHGGLSLRAFPHP